MFKDALGHVLPMIGKPAVMEIIQCNIKCARGRELNENKLKLHEVEASKVLAPDSYINVCIDNKKIGIIYIYNILNYRYVHVYKKDNAVK